MVMVMVMMCCLSFLLINKWIFSRVYTHMTFLVLLHFVRIEQKTIHL